MAGVGGDKGRKLRVRGVAAASAVPMTRSTAAAAASIKATVSRQVEAPRRTTTTTSKVALKRAAALDDNIRTSVTAPLQQPKKRAALANLTNCSNLPSTRSIMASLKPPVKPKAQAAAIRSREVEAIKDNLEPTLGKKADTNIPLRAQNDENALLGRETGPLDVFKSTARVIPCVATQTSASSQQITCLLKDLKPKTRQGYCFDEDVEGEGWSCKNYTNIDDNIKDPQMCSSERAKPHLVLPNLYTFGVLSWTEFDSTTLFRLQTFRAGGVRQSNPRPAMQQKELYTACREGEVQAAKVQVGCMLCTSSYYPSQIF
eukprot:c18327_g1_i1 orf=600-1547(+)